MVRTGEPHESNSATSKANVDAFLMKPIKTDLGSRTFIHPQKLALLTLAGKGVVSVTFGKLASIMALTISLLPTCPM